VPNNKIRSDAYLSSNHVFHIIISGFFLLYPVINVLLHISVHYLLI
jgi:hypothetical protein